MSASAASAERKTLGAWYTPPDLVDVLVDGILEGFERPAAAIVRVLDPACGDGRLLSAIADRLTSLCLTPELTGCDIDAGAIAAVSDVRVRTLLADALAHDWGDTTFDLVVGNPPFLSQMAASTSRGGSSRHGGGPYADAAAEFLALATRLATPDGGRVALVLPQSILGARDAGPVRNDVGEAADISWSWWEPRQAHFEANVNVCVIGLRRPATEATSPTSWTSVVTDRLGVPAFDIDRLQVAGTLADRAELNANFRDEYYALVPAVSDDADGPPLVTSGLIDPARCRWGERPIRFAKQTFTTPRVDVGRLTGRFPAWAERKLVPKVLIANQTRIVEAVADPDGSWLPGVPVTTATPRADNDLWEIAAVLTSPIASILAWHAGAGTGLSTTAVRVGPVSLGATPWPSGELRPAVEALRNGELRACAAAVCNAYGVPAAEQAPMVNWWTEQLPVDCA